MLFPGLEQEQPRDYQEALEKVLKDWAGVPNIPLALETPLLTLKFPWGPRSPAQERASLADLATRLRIVFPDSGIRISHLAGRFSTLASLNGFLGARPPSYKCTWDVQIHYYGDYGDGTCDVDDTPLVPT